MNRIKIRNHTLINKFTCKTPSTKKQINQVHVNSRQNVVFPYNYVSACPTIRTAFNSRWTFDTRMPISRGDSTARAKEFSWGISLWNMCFSSFFLLFAETWARVYILTNVLCLCRIVTGSIKTSHFIITEEYSSAILVFKDYGLVFSDKQDLQYVAHV